MRWDEARESASSPTLLSNAPGQPRRLAFPVGRWVAYVAGLDMQSHPFEPGLVFVLLPMHGAMAITMPIPHDLHGIMMALWIITCTDGLPFHKPTSPVARDARGCAVHWAELH